MSLMPQPKGKKKKKKKKAAEEEAAPTEGGSPEPGDPDSPAKKKKKKKGKKKKKKSDVPEVPPLKYGPLQTVDQAVNNTFSWYQNNNIGKKLSVGVLTTASFTQRQQTFEKMNPINERAPILPQSQFLGQPADKDSFINRKIKHLNDIEFESDDDPEEIKVLRRENQMVLTEENIKKYVNDETIKLNLEAHYWLSNSFISKLGQLAPNLQELSLRRMTGISNPVFAEIFKFTSQLRVLDVSGCSNLYVTALLLLFDKCKTIELI